MTNDKQKRLEELNDRLHDLGSWMVCRGVPYVLPDAFRRIAENSDLEFHRDALEKNAEYHRLSKEYDDLREELSIS